VNVFEAPSGGPPVGANSWWLLASEQLCAALHGLQDKDATGCEKYRTEPCNCTANEPKSLFELSDSACSLEEGGSSGARTHEVWLVQEYCSLGTLQVHITLQPLAFFAVHPLVRLFLRCLSEGVGLQTSLSGRHVRRVPVCISLLACCNWECVLGRREETGRHAPSLPG
jgi:hypothetical protein